MGTRLAYLTYMGIRLAHLTYMGIRLAYLTYMGIRLAYLSYMGIQLAYLSYGPSPDSHAHVYPGNEGGLVHFCCGAGQYTRLGPPYGGCWQGGAGGGVMGMGGHLLH